MEKETFSPYSPRTFGYGDFQYGLILSLILIFYVFFISGNDQSFSKFFFVYLKFEKFHLSTGAASWGIILYWTFFSVCTNTFCIDQFLIANRRNATNITCSDNQISKINRFILLDSRLKHFLAIF